MAYIVCLVMLVMPVFEAANDNWRYYSNASHTFATCRWGSHQSEFYKTAFDVAGASFIDFTFGVNAESKAVEQTSLRHFLIISQHWRDGSGPYPVIETVVIQWQNSEGLWESQLLTFDLVISDDVGIVGQLGHQQKWLTQSAFISLENSTLKMHEGLLGKLARADAVTLRIGDDSIYEFDDSKLANYRAWWEHLEEGCDGTH
jgi:hypothetical protein